MTFPLKNPATQRDVARLAGVSHMTVSRVIQGIRSVAPATADPRINFSAIRRL